MATLAKHRNVSQLSAVTPQGETAAFARPVIGVQWRQPSVSVARIASRCMWIMERSPFWSIVEYSKNRESGGDSGGVEARRSDLGELPSALRSALERLASGWHWFSRVFSQAALVDFVIIAENCRD